MERITLAHEVYIEPEISGIRGVLGRFKQSFVEALTEDDGQNITGTELLCDLLEAVCPDMVLDGVFGDNGQFWVMDCIQRDIFMAGGVGPPLRERKLQVERLVERLNQAWTVCLLPKLGESWDMPPFAVVPCLVTSDPEEAQMILNTLSKEYPGAVLLNPAATYRFPKWRS